MDRRDILEKIFDEMESLKRSLSRPRLKCFEMEPLTLLQWKVLLVIVRLKKATTTEISSKIGITKSAVSQQIDALQKAGYIKQLTDKDDRRKRIYVPTKKAGELVERMRNEFVSHLDALFARLTDDELMEFLKILRKMNSRNGT